MKSALLWILAFVALAALAVCTGAVGIAINAVTDKVGNS